MTTSIRTQVGAANTDRIVLRNHDLVTELVGQVGFTHAALLAITGQPPTPSAVRVADAVLVTFIDHGFQPSALAARLTYHVAPEAIQGAVAAGLLGVGSLILGTTEQTGRLLVGIAEDVAAGASEEDAVRRAVKGVLDAGDRIPGIGHALHKHGDPRVAPLLAVAAEEGVASAEIRRLHAVVACAAQLTGRELLPNAAGVSAALLLGIGIPWSLLRGFALISRAAGLLAHIAEEAEQPVTPAIRETLRVASWLEDR